MEHALTEVEIAQFAANLVKISFYISIIIGGICFILWVIKKFKVDLTIRHYQKLLSLKNNQLQVTQSMVEELRQQLNYFESCMKTLKESCDRKQKVINMVSRELHDAQYGEPCRNPATAKQGTPLIAAQFVEPELERRRELPTSIWEYNIAAGLAFEQEVLEKLQSAGYQVLHNVRIPAGEDKTSQNDIIVLHKTGVYTIECKNWTGNVIGKSDWNRWIKINKFNPAGTYWHDFEMDALELNSPLRQNEFHVSALKTHFLCNGFKNIPCHSYVVFKNQEKFHLTQYGPCHNIVMFPQLLDTLERACRANQTFAVLSSETIQNLKDMLMQSQHSNSPAVDTITSFECKNGRVVEKYN